MVGKAMPGLEPAGAISQKQNGRISSPLQETEMIKHGNRDRANGGQLKAHRGSMLGKTLNAPHSPISFST